MIFDKKENRQVCSDENNPQMQQKSVRYLQKQSWETEMKNLHCNHVLDLEGLVDD